MAYCVKCGKKLTSGTKFCPECGTPVSTSISGEYIQREHVYVGIVKKCPVCGEELPSMTAVCPTCGHEINSTQVHPELQKLIDELNACDQSIVDEEAHNTISNKVEPVRGWRLWNTTAKVIWTILNCIALCVPLVIYLLFCSKRFRKFTPSTKRKVSLIENFQIPSERQAIIEFLYFIRDKVSALVAQTATSDVLYWAKLWNIKSEQLYKKAQSSIPSDVTVSGLYHEITSSVQQVKSSVKRKKIYSFIVVAVYIIIVIFIEAFIVNRIAKLANIPSVLSFFSIILEVCAVLLVAFFIWANGTLSKGVKCGTTVVICILILVFSVRSCQHNIADFTSKVGDICNNNGVVLSGMDINELTKVASIRVQSPTYEKAMIDMIETELFDVAREYKFELGISFIDEENFTIRVSEIDEYGAKKHFIDNTTGIIGFVKSKCLEYGVKLGRIDNYYDETIKFSIQVPAINKSVMDNLQEDIFAAKGQFDYSGCEIEFRTMDKYYGDLLRIVEIEDNGLVSLEERVSEFNQTMVDGILANTTAKCKEEKIEMIIKVLNEHGEILWKAFVDANGNQINVDVYHFRIEAEEICRESGASIDNISISNRDMSFYVYADSRRRGKINKIEEELISAYQTYSDLMEMSITFWDDDYPSEHKKIYNMDLHGSDFFDKIEETEKKYKIRDTEVDSSGTITHSNDNTSLI